ncbi:MAG: hypothetical protein JST62_13270 [Bacteroidetes bacterium]|nr:hypothetical protein [Bacteroidota bacterium]
MKKVMTMAAIVVAAMVSAKDGIVKMEFSQSNFRNECKETQTPPDLKLTNCKWVQSSCGEGGLLCRDEEIHHEEEVEFQYLLEDVFCGGCFIEC